MEINTSSSKSIPSMKTSSQTELANDSKLNARRDNTEKNTKSDVKQDQQNVDGSATKQMLEEKIESMNKLLEVKNTSHHFSLHEETNRFYVEIKDRNTQEVVKEIPTKEFLDMIGRIMDFAGLILDKKI